eukprot:scaffold2679_cov251-Pinguiococcus_pyrenoidosus.AAC.5
MPSDVSSVARPSFWDSMVPTRDTVLKQQVTKKDRQPQRFQICAPYPTSRPPDKLTASRKHNTAHSLSMRSAIALQRGTQRCASRRKRTFQCCWRGEIHSLARTETPPHRRLNPCHQSLPLRSQAFTPLQIDRAVPPAATLQIGAQERQKSPDESFGGKMRGNVFFK